MEREHPNEIEITPAMLRQMQVIQLEILIEFDRVCKKRNIPYSLDGGTLLGAVRHKGFIPWDDDIDLIMLRKDYERFFETGKTELDTKRFFLQEHRTDPHYYVGYPRIRRNNTVYSRIGHEHIKYCQGVFIDVFVLDNVPDSKVLRPLYKAAAFCLRKTLWARTGRKLHANSIMRMWFYILSRVPKNFVFMLVDMLKDACNKKSTELVGHMMHPYPRPEVTPYGIPASLMEGFTELKFEGRSFQSVKEYDKYLTMLYGDYMTLPPEENRKPHIHLSAFSPVTEEL